MLSVTEDVACSKTVLKTQIPQSNQKSKKQHGILKTAYNLYKEKWMYVMHKSGKKTIERENKSTQKIR